ncbi:MAG: bacillithiol biosynthesis BshC [Planctomycetia bacterium]|jgi:uncharacterized protein YllA (UPF0747 family)|nr:bacillithiol biosynthesis BshC [Planctomycetia bacterium]NCG56003.1 bacillithiol biosynthesis BshC [Pseudomonadota bacterium]
MKKSPQNALDLRLRGGAVAEDLFGKLALGSEDVARDIGDHHSDRETRERWIQALRPMWATLDLPESSRLAQERLNDPECRIIVTGQQPALWGGPLLCTTKLLAATRLAADLNSQGIPAVPLFWVADDDHDVSELDPGEFVSKKSIPAEFEPGLRPFYSLTPASSASERLEALKVSLGDAPHAESVLQKCEKLISEEVDPGREFVELMLELLPDEGWLPVFPRALRELQMPLLKMAHEKAEEFQAEIRQASMDQEALGIPAPVSVRSGSPFFWHDENGDRVRLEKMGTRSTAQLLGDPEAFSPDALFRGIVQDVLLDPAAVIVGPTELCYTLQTRRLRQLWNLPRPLLLPRPAVRPVQRDHLDRLEELGIGLDRLGPKLDPIEVVPSPKAELRGQELSLAADPVIQILDSLAHEQHSNPTLNRKAARMSLRWRQQLNALKRSVEEGLDRDVEARRQKVLAVLEDIFPGGLEPERSRNLLDLISWQGFDCLSEVAAVLDTAIRRWDGCVCPWIISENYTHPRANAPQKSPKEKDSDVSSC